MKTSILIFSCLAFFMFAGIQSVNAQATHNSDPELLFTGDSPTSPVAGKTYTYAVTVDPTGGTFTWWATTKTSFITGGVLQNNAVGSIAASELGSSSDYNNSTSTASSIDLTWSSTALSNALDTTTFVVVHYQAPSTECADNLKVYQISPVNAFLVDIKNLDNDDVTSSLGYGVNDTCCVADVQGASWNGTAMVYDYGTNILYYEVVAANFTGTWTPQFNLTGLLGDQTATIEWDYDTNFSSPVAVTSGATNGTFTSGTIVTTNASTTDTGVSIYVRVTIDNGTYETLTNQTIDLAVKGTNSDGEEDVTIDSSNTTATPTTSDFADNTAVQIIRRRPTVTSNTTGGTLQ